MGYVMLKHQLSRKGKVLGKSGEQTECIETLVLTGRRKGGKIK